jgi:PD-(D/E)XK endonuclease
VGLSAQGDGARFRGGSALWDKPSLDFIVQGGQKLWRVQTKAVVYMRDGLYSICMQRNVGRKLRPYGKDEVDFIAVYIIPEKTWYILPVREVANRRMLRFRPKGYHRPDIYAHHREAWHLLREPTA